MLAVLSLLVLATAGSATTASASLDPGTRFYVPNPRPEALKQRASLLAQHDKKAAAQLTAMLSNGHAVWFTGGTPKQVQQDVHVTMDKASDQGAVPVLVAYNLPFRDCSQYSAGGAASTDAYLAWIDGFARGIGSGKAVVLLEPDGLGIIPWYKQFMGGPDESSSYEWCQPAEANPATAAADRFAALKGAVDRLEALPNVSVYLDATHSNWLGAGDAADRLMKAGVDEAQGFFLNVSNYEPTSHLLKYGSWISQCIAITEAVSWWHVAWCASQYYPASPNDFSTWQLTDEAYAGMAWAIEGRPLKHFVIDTSRNGQGPWTPPADHPAGDPQTWCNPPDRGVGLRPTANTGAGLVDAYLWVKVPGESDGSCYRWTTGPTDPVRDMVDPPAGAWFPQMALELAQNADPPLVP